MRLLFAGTPDVACPTLAALAEDPRHEVVAVLTRPDAAVGRHRTPRPSPVAAEAASRGIPTIKASSVRSGPGHDAVAGLDVDAAVVVAYGGLIPPDLLAAPRHGWLNLHFSLLPRWRGAAPVQRALMAGDKVTGACVFQLVPQLDAGPIHTSRTTRIGTTETAGELLDRLAHTTPDLVLAALERIESGLPPVDQPSEGMTHAAKIDPDDARIDPTARAIDIDRLVRGTSPAPGAWAMLEGQRFKVLRTGVPDATCLAAVAGHLAPGRLAATKKHLYLGTGEGTLELREVQPFGRKVMRGADWARGALTPDDTAEGNGPVLS
ncbi:methionyl-tRNA formyltransferase [Acidipropionibacterium timonense]|uniref:methionyl-tRNA formyltransferase n=1 Tax=Acidipropionibacterium timonense TaxID=2161818 RepID=UPI0010303AD8|nr:methionyl-tRNA formyltransferase [Acidipropionibacterium timonense]